MLLRHAFAAPVVLKMPLPWLREPLEVFNRKEFTVTAGQLVGVAVIVLLTAPELPGPARGKFVQNVFTVTKTLALAALIVIGLTVGASRAAVEANTADVWGGATTTARFAEIHDLVGGPAL